MKTAFVYSPHLSDYQLSESHPFKPIRLELTRSLLHHAGLLDESQEVTPEPFSESQLCTLHDPHYVEVVKAVSRGERADDAYSHGLGTSDNPIFPGMHDAILGICAATATAVDLVASGKVQRAANISGGLHHAMRDKMSGFCTYNDLALGIQQAVNKYGVRVAYLDLDAHHGDGVQWLFYERAEVMTLSMHESGRYLFPGTGHTYEVGKEAGRGLSLNMPLEPFTEDDSYMECFETTVPRALEVFRPDLIVLQAGADMHYNDPLADLALSTKGISESYRRVSELADEFCEGRLVATGGGGYDPYRTVPRVWSLLWGAVSRQEVPEEVPQAWLEQWRPQSKEPLAKTFHDDMQAWEAMPRREQITSHNQAVAKRLLNTVEPIWEERFGVTVEKR